MLLPCTVLALMSLKLGSTMRSAAGSEGSARSALGSGLPRTSMKTGGDVSGFSEMGQVEPPNGLDLFHGAIYHPPPQKKTNNTKE